MSWFIARASEPSTWAGIAGIFIAVGQAFPAASVVTTPLAGIAGGLAASIKDPGAAK